MRHPLGNDSPTSQGFACDVLDTEEAHFSIKQRHATIVYVRVVSGSLPSFMSNVLIAPYGGLLGRPERDGFKPAPVTLRLPSSRTYSVWLLASLPALDVMRPYLRAALHPANGIDAAAVPVALEGLPGGFRATAGRLTPGNPPRDEVAAAALRIGHPPPDALRRSLALRELIARDGADAPVEPILSALEDEIEPVRYAAANAVRVIAERLPVAPFLAVIADKRPLNSAACLAAAYVFAAHPDETPVEVLLDLYTGVHDENAKIAAVGAMGRFGDRAPVEVLADILAAQRGSHGIRARMQAARSLGMLGARAPVEALVAGMESHQPEIVVEAARALAQHPAPIPNELRERALQLSDLMAARQLVYGKYQRRGN